MLKLAAIFILWPAAVFGQTYLVEPTLADCQARSRAQCAALKCDADQTHYWWECRELAVPTKTGGVSGTGGTTAIIIHPGTPYDVSTTNDHGTAGLSAAEIAAIQTEAELGDALTGKAKKK